MTETTDQMLVDVQRLAIELEELRRENAHLKQLFKDMKIAANDNAELYERDMKWAKDHVRDMLHGKISSKNVVPALQIRRDEGLQQLKSTRRGWVK